MNHPSPAEVDATLRELFRSLDARWRPETVALTILPLVEWSEDERNVLRPATNAGIEEFWSSMSDDFHRPVDMARQLRVARELFDREIQFGASDISQIEAWLVAVEATIGKRFGSNDFKKDRLNAAQRVAVGVELSRRQYNKRFRLAARMERKVRRLAKEQLKRSLTLASKSRLASRIDWENFRSDLNSALLISYFVARCNLRSVFTNSAQERPFDEICEMLLNRCRLATTTNWWSIAHVLPIAEVIGHLDDEQKGVLLGEYFERMKEAAALLRELWETNDIDEDMVVRKGNDSTTWNVTAGAWNRLRDGWIALLYEMGWRQVIEQMCPGKVPRLMAADVVWWHRRSGGGLHPDIAVWKQLPRPWKVIDGTAECTLDSVVDVCRAHSIDPEKSGWTVPRPAGAVARFSPTPELVHGVAVGSPVLAAAFRKAGIFSGKAAKSTVPGPTVEEIRRRHREQQEMRRKSTGSPMQ